MGISQELPSSKGPPAGSVRGDFGVIKSHSLPFIFPHSQVPTALGQSLTCRFMNLFKVCTKAEETLLLVFSSTWLQMQPVPFRGQEREIVRMFLPLKLQPRKSQMTKDKSFGPGIPPNSQF